MKNIIFSLILMLILSSCTEIKSQSTSSSTITTSPTQSNKVESPKNLYDIILDEAITPKLGDSLSKFKSKYGSSDRTSSLYTFYNKHLTIENYRGNKISSIELIIDEKNIQYPDLKRYIDKLIPIDSINKGEEDIGAFTGEEVGMKHHRVKYQSNILAEAKLDQSWSAALLGKFMVDYHLNETGARYISIIIKDWNP